MLPLVLVLVLIIRAIPTLLSRQVILFNNKGLELTKRGGNDRRPGHWVNSSESYYGLA